MVLVTDFDKNWWDKLPRKIFLRNIPLFPLNKIEYAAGMKLSEQKLYELVTIQRDTAAATEIITDLLKKEFKWLLKLN